MFRAPRLDGPWERADTPQDAAPVRARHGAMLAISFAEYEALCAAFPVGRE